MQGKNLAEWLEHGRCQEMFAVFIMIIKQKKKNHLQMPGQSQNKFALG